MCPSKTITVCSAAIVSLLVNPDWIPKDYVLETGNFQVEILLLPCSRWPLVDIKPHYNMICAWVEEEYFFQVPGKELQGPSGSSIPLPITPLCTLQVHTHTHTQTPPHSLLIRKIRHKTKIITQSFKALRHFI